MNSRGKTFDIAIVGAGILGVSISFWLSEVYDCTIALIEKEDRVAFHTSSRNTNVIHRPFYLDPEKKKVFARVAEKSYYMWLKLSTLYNLPWKQVGTLEVALEDSDLDTLDKYRNWSLSNGMKEDEAEVLDASGVKKLEPEVKCAGAIFSKTDTSVSYGDFTSTIAEFARKNGVTFIENSEVKQIEETKDGLNLTIENKPSKVKSSISCGLLVNAAGGGSVDIAHMMRVGRNYTDLHFRGEYWVVDEPFASKINRNIYSVAKYREFPFLDPHFIVRANGRREIGPNAVLVSGPYAYNGLSSSKSEFIEKIFERPNMPKLHLFTNTQFLSLVWNEWRSSLSKKAMCGRVKQFIPSLNDSMLNQKGLSGVRSSLIDSQGFVPEAIQLKTDASYHILNYNSPGATGAPSFSSYIVLQLQNQGYLNGLRTKETRGHAALWKFEDASDLRIS